MPLSESVNYEMMSKGYKDILSIARKYSSKIYISTITPYKGFRDDTVMKESEGIRLSINEWIRNQSIFDGVIDMDEISRDNSNPERLSDLFKGDDCLHFPSEAGKVIVESIDVKELIS